MKLKNLTGKKRWRLRIIKRLPNDENGRVQWFCICKCGNSKVATSHSIRQGYVKSCGCLRIELSRKRIRKLLRQRRRGEYRGESNR